MPRFTSRRRAGFESSVWTPFSVRVVNIRYSATVASWGRFRSRQLTPPTGERSRTREPLGARRPHARGLVDVEQRGAEEEHRREHEPCEERGRPLGVVGEALEQSEDEIWVMKTSSVSVAQPTEGVDSSRPARGRGRAGAPPRPPSDSAIRRRHGEPDER